MKKNKKYSTYAAQDRTCRECANLMQKICKAYDLEKSVAIFQCEQEEFKNFTYTKEK